MPQDKNNLIYKGETKRKGVLGTLEGICADCIKATRNGRHYSDLLWSKAFKQPTVVEQFQCGGIFGQLGHPPDEQSENEEFANIAICMPEPPVKGADGKLRGRWDILDTPQGRILKCLCDYGYKIGISSRGNGDIVEEYDGTESVDPETFEFKGFDAVLLPAVKSARLNLVTESLDKDKEKGFRKALRESIDNSNDVEKEVMIQTLDDLGIEYKEPSETEEGEEVVAVEQTNDAAVSDGADLVDALQAALQEVNELRNQIIDLNEKISVSNTKEIRLESQVTKLQSALAKQGNQSKVAEAMKHQLVSMKEQLESLASEKERQKALAETYKKKLSDVRGKESSLNESLTTNNNIIESLRGKIKTLEKSSNERSSKDKVVIESLQEQVKSLKDDSQIKHSQYVKKLEESNTAIQKYKNIAKTAVDKYIESKATVLGISSKDIKARLNESFSFKEIDSICESLRGYNLNISKLPFQLNSVKKVAIKDDISKRAIENPDDIVDKSILDLL